MGLKIRKLRVDKGSWNDLIDAAYTNYKEHGRESIRDAFTEAVADKVLQRYQVKIAAGFRRAGVEIEDGEPLTAEKLVTIIQDRTGLDIQHLSPEGVTTAVDKLLAERLSALMGVTVTTVFDRDAMMAAMEESVKQAIRDGRAAEFIGKHAMSAARRFATFKRRGVESPEDHRRIMLAWYQKKYRRTHRLVWDTQGAGGGGGDGGGQMGPGEE